MSDYWQEFLKLLSEEELIRFIRRAELADKPELAIQLYDELEKQRESVVS